MDETKQDEREHRIRVRAFEIWEAEGRPVGRADEHWQAALIEIEAETEIEAAPAAPEPLPSQESKPKKAGPKAA